MTPTQVYIDAAARNDRRIYATARIALALSLAGHLAMTVIFHLLDRADMAVVNLVSSVVLVAALGLLLLRHTPQLAWWVLVIEFAANNLIATVELGVEPGFLLYPTIGAGIICSIPFDTALRRLAAFAVSLALCVCAAVWSVRAGPIAPFTADLSLLFLVGNMLFVATGGGAVLWYYAVEIARAEARLDIEYARSEALLLNMLPAPIAARLKEGEKLIVDDHEDATVIFADIVGFTAIAAVASAAELVTLLREVVSRFDALAERHGVEKIKTIGDAYLAVVGAPVADPRHALKAARLSLDMIDAARDVKTPSGAPVEIRVGLHSGPIVSGVIGEKRMAFDLWGDTVNTAARMEATGVRGRVHISDAVRRRLGDAFAYEAREPVQVKGKGFMTTWLLGAPAAVA